MPSLSTSRTVAHSPEDLYRLILDVESYSDFLPFCRRTATIQRQASPEGTILISEMEVGFSIFKEKYTSEIIGENETKTIRIRALDGPFRFLRATWRFQQLEAGRTKIEFDLEYEFKNRMLGLTAGRVFDKVFGSMIVAFENRADAILGSHKGNAVP
jgi:coenzyme Q-binding protein COQ10